MLLERIRSLLFPSPYEKWRRRCGKWVELSRVFESRFPESARLLEAALNDPKAFLADYGPETEIDGKCFPEIFKSIKGSDDVDPEYIFKQLFDYGFGVFAELDWKTDIEEIYQFVDPMLRGYGFDTFDWSFKDDYDDESTQNYEFLFIIDDRLKGSGYRLQYFDSQADAHAFAVVEDQHYKFSGSIEPYY